MRLLKRFCVLLLGLAMALAMSSVLRADAVTDWNAIAIQIIANAPCPAAPCANPLVNRFPSLTGTLDTTYHAYLAAHSLSESDPGVAVGAAAAAGIIALRANDG